MAWMWVSFAIHYPLAMLVGDVCNELDIALNGGDGSTTSALNEIIRCANMSEFRNLRDIAYEAVNASVKSGTT